MPPPQVRRIGRPGGSAPRSSPDVFTWEFFLQNHADIISTVIVIIGIGIIPTKTSPYSSLFINLHHNATDPLISRETGLPMLYTYGFSDVFAVFFYGLVCLVIHGVIHQYLIDKAIRKLHLSMVRRAKFHESGQLFIFYIFSSLWAVLLIRREHQQQVPLSLSSLWADYPRNGHSDMSYQFKFFFIVQLAYWVHFIPQVYLQLLQKMPREQVSVRLKYGFAYIFFICAAYLLNYTRLTLCLLLLQYLSESAFHASRMFHYSKREDLSEKGFQIYNGLFVAARLSSITIAALTFGFGLGQQPSANQPLFIDGNFNSLSIRIFCLIATCALQAGLMWRFVVFHLKRRRNQRSSQVDVTRSRMNLREMMRN